MQTPYPPYEKIGVKVDGAYRQLSDTILQIENEHYSDIRPKRVARRGERPLEALSRSGVEYIEIRNIDVNPFLPVGIDMAQAHFLDAFLISCLMMDEKDICPAECDMVDENMQAVLNRGREPGLRLQTPEGASSLKERGLALLEQIVTVAALLDDLHRGDDYRRAVAAQAEKMESPALTPSARILDSLEQSGLEYHEWILARSREHTAAFRLEPFEAEAYRELERRAAASISAQRELEAADTRTFDEFLSDFLAVDMGDGQRR